MATATAPHPHDDRAKGKPASLRDDPPTPPASTDNASIAPPREAEHEADRPSTSENQSPSRVASPITSPPYWTHQLMRGASVESVPAIILQDNERGGSEGARGVLPVCIHACWTKRVEVTDHVVVNGSATNLAAFVVWNIRVQMLSGSYMNIRKRYSEFDAFRRDLILTFPTFEAAVPMLPPKSVLMKFRPRFLEKRRVGLQYFLNCIMLNPEFSGSPVLKDFLFS